MTSQHSAAHFHDLSVKGQCVGCGGTLEVRVTPEVAWSFCRTCHLLSRSAVGTGPSGTVVAIQAGHA